MENWMPSSASNLVFLVSSPVGTTFPELGQRIITVVIGTGTLCLWHAPRAGGTAPILYKTGVYPPNFFLRDAQCDGRPRVRRAATPRIKPHRNAMKRHELS